jgi:hypothetical protein
MVYMETRPGNRKARQHLAPQRASGVRSRRILIGRHHVGGISGSDLTGPHHHTASAEQRCGLTIGYRGLTPDPGSRARNAASNWTPLPTRMTTSRCTKEWAWTSLLISCANNRFVPCEFIAGVPTRSHLFVVEALLTREPCGRARRRARSRDVLKSAPPENPAPRP